MPPKEESTPDNYVFGNLVNYGNVNENLKKWAEVAGVRKHISYHVARHSYATLCLTVGIDIYMTSQLLGHTTIRHTQRYARIINTKKDEAVSLFDGVFE